MEQMKGFDGAAEMLGDKDGAKDKEGIALTEGAFDTLGAELGAALVDGAAESVGLGLGPIRRISSLGGKALSEL